MAQEFFWYELMTSDVDAAAAFYREVVGWQTQDLPLPGERYTIVAVGERGVGGIMEMPEQAAAGGMRPQWLGYIHADDVDAAVGGVVAAGGRMVTPPADIPGGVGRFATVTDPQGAMFMLMKPSGTDMPPVAQTTPGAVSWRELVAVDGAAAHDFYAAQFGWREVHKVDLGGPDPYLLFACGSGPGGGMMTRRDPATPPHWLFYFTVDGIDAARERVERAGGRLVNGPNEVPGGSWVAEFADPQGAAFALTSATR